MKKRELVFMLVVVILIVFILKLVIPNKKEVIIRDKTIIEIDPTRPIVALTYDDGPNYEYTIPILDILYEYKALASFFIIGKNIEGTEAVLKKIEGEGHEIANHTFDHYDLTTLNSKEIKEQIGMTDRKVREVINGYSLDYVRPPYGKYNEDVIKAIDYPTCLWSLDSKDWTINDSQKIADHVIAEVKDGDVIIMHDSSVHSVKATKLILSKLVKKGYQFVTLNELYEYREDILKIHQIYK